MHFSAIISLVTQEEVQKTLRTQIVVAGTTVHGNTSRAATTSSRSSLQPPRAPPYNLTAVTTRSPHQGEGQIYTRLGKRKNTTAN